MGNMLFPVIHHLHADDHHHTQLEYECEECLTIEINNNYTFDSQKFNLQLSKSNLFEYPDISLVEFNLYKKYLSRAPPVF